MPAKKRSRFDSAARIRATRSTASGSPALCVELILERELKTAAQFRGSLTSEGDRRHVLDLIHTGRDAGGHPPGHLVGFPGTRARLHEQIPIEIRHDAIPRTVDRRVGARYSCATSRRYAASFGSPCLAAACSNTFSPQALPKSHHLHADSSAA